MPVTPTGPLSLPLANLRSLLADCAAWQGWIAEVTGQLVDAAAAAERVHLVDVTPPADGSGYAYTAAELESLLPLAVVDDFSFPDGRLGGDGYVTRRDAIGAFNEGGKLILRFEDEVVPEDSDRDAKLRFMNRVGAVISELQAKGGGDNDYLSVQQVVQWEPYARSDQTVDAQQGSHTKIGFVVVWGI